MVALACCLTPTTSSAAEPPPVPVPDMALLEYLAELVEVDGELVGAIDMGTPAADGDAIPATLPVKAAPAADKTVTQKEQQPPAKGDRS